MTLRCDRGHFVEIDHVSNGLAHYICNECGPGATYTGGSGVDYEDVEDTKKRGQAFAKQYVRGGVNDFRRNY